MDSAKIRQCEICNSALIDGYAEMKTALTGERKQLCFTCARSELQAKRAMENDHALRSGTLERAFKQLEG